MMTEKKLTQHQNKVLGWILDGAEIQVTIEGNCTTTCDVVFEGGDTEPIRKDTFEALKENGFIKLKYHPSIYAERWGVANVPAIAFRQLGKLDEVLK